MAYNWLLKFSLKCYKYWKKKCGLKMNLTLAQPGLFLSKNTNKIQALFTKVHMTATLLNYPVCFWPMWIGTEDPTHHCRAEQSPPDKKPRLAVSICNSQANEFMHLCAWSAAELRIRLNQVRVWFHNQREKIKSILPTEPQQLYLAMLSALLFPGD